MKAEYIQELLAQSPSGTTVVLPEQHFEFTEPIAITGLQQVTVDARRATFMMPAAAKRWLTIDRCDGMRWRGGRWLGADTIQRVVDLCTKTNAEKTEPTNADFGHALCINKCEEFTLENPVMRGYDRCLDVHQSHNFTLECGSFVGIYDGKMSKWIDGVFQTIAKDVARSIYAVNVRNSHFFAWTDGSAKLAGGALVAGSGDDGGSSRYMRIERLQCWDSADNGVYGSSAPYAKVTDSRFFNFHNGHAVKLRGPGVQIRDNEAWGGYWGFAVEGIGTKPDEFGAAAYGCRVEGNLVEGARDGAMQIDQTAGGLLFPRHTTIVGNHCYSCGTGATDKRRALVPPIYLEGGYGYHIDGNVAVGYAHDAFLYLASPTGRTIIGSGNVTSKSPAVVVGKSQFQVPANGLSFM